MSNGGDKMRDIMESMYPEMNYKVVSEESQADTEHVAAISQLIADRTEDADSESKLSTEAFVSLVNKMGIPMSKETLMDLVEKGNLESVIKNANIEEVHFKGQKDIDPESMSVDKAKDVVANMAKRSAKKGIKK